MKLTCWTKKSATIPTLSSSSSFPEWRLLDTGQGSGSENMATAEALLESCRQGNSPPVLHLYTWEKPTITVGYLQQVEGSIDMKECRYNRIEVVRRITGGKAVVHDNDLSYSLLFPSKGAVIPEGLGASYYKISQGFTQGLSHLGIPAYLSDGDGLLGLSIRERNGMPACFLTRIRYEVLCFGRKLMGSAQRRFDQWVLQQGTILIGLDKTLWAKLLKFPIYKGGREVIDQLGSEVISIEEITGGSIDETPFKQALVEGLASVLGVNFITRGLTIEEEEVRNRIMGVKYRDLGCDYLKNM